MLPSGRRAEHIQDGRDQPDLPVARLLDLPPSSGTLLISGAEAIAAAAVDLGRSATFEVRQCLRSRALLLEPGPGGAGARRCRRPLPGIRWLALVQSVGDDLPGPVRVPDPAASSVEVREMSNVPLEMTIVDRRAALLVRRASGEAVRVGPSVLLEALVDCFDTLWTSIPVSRSEAADEMRSPTTPRALLHLLATGSTDQAIGRELGTSERTVQRRIHDLMAELGARSRFQAGVHATQRGWI